MPIAAVKLIRSNKDNEIALPAIKATPKMSAKELSALRERMNLSRALFAKYLRTNVRTLENWEQGRAPTRRPHY
jgi:DNA-binding transcriptional regulator YiaG